MNCCQVCQHNNPEQLHCDNCVDFNKFKLMDMESVKSIITSIIKDTCTHWICADEKELDRVTNELEVKITKLINDKAGNGAINAKVVNIDTNIGDINL